MKKYRYTYEPDSISMPALSEGTLFLDIETTGFDRRSTFLTIIGLAWQEKDQIIIEQWLNETGPKEEPLLLLELERFLTNQHFPTLIHYNGTTFDLPYLKAKYEQYHLPTSLCKCSSLDLYHLAKKYKNFLHLPGLKQKNLEETFGLFRADKLSGQELIEVYLEAICQNDSCLMDAYLLHNKEDMEGMIFLQNLIRLDNFFQGGFQIQEWKESLEIKLTGDFYLYQPIFISLSDIHFTFRAGNVSIKLPIRHMEAKYFYENYKDYYYLPAEDCAMHKSVAAYVEKEYRQKATKETCYTKKTASFLPFPLPANKRARKECLKECCHLNLFYEHYGDDTAWVIKDITDPACRQLYVRCLLNLVL